MIKILFVCHGNICRSPMAEFVLKDMVRKKGWDKQFYIASSATSNEEIGNGVHRGTIKKLQKHNISCNGKRAIRLQLEDYDKYDYFIGMDDRNITNMKHILDSQDDTKIFRLLDLSDSPRNIADPWYTGDFDSTYNDIVEGCNLLLKHLKSALD